MGRALILLMAALPAFGAAANGIVVTGQIRCAAFLSPAGADPGLLLEGSGSVVTAHIPAGRASLTISLRTNCHYRLMAAGGSGPGLRLVEGRVSAAGGGGHLTAKALDVTFTPVAVTAKPAVFGEGRAVSRGGNNLTTDNVILLEILLDWAGAGEAVANFRVELVP